MAIGSDNHRIEMHPPNSPGAIAVTGIKETDYEMEYCKVVTECREQFRHPFLSYTVQGPTRESIVLKTN